MTSPNLNDSLYDGEDGLALELPADPSSQPTPADHPSDDTDSIEPEFVIDEKVFTSGEKEKVDIAVKRESARSQIAYLYVSSFLAIIGVVFIYSMIRTLATNDLKDLLIAVSGILSGPLGFIIGYYFKVEDENKNN